MKKIQIRDCVGEEIESKQEAKKEEPQKQLQTEEEKE